MRTKQLTFFRCLGLVLAAAMLLLSACSADGTKHDGPGYTVGKVQIWPPEPLKVTIREDGVMDASAVPDMDAVMQLSMSNPPPRDPYDSSPEEYCAVGEDGMNIGQRWLKIQGGRMENFKVLIDGEQIKVAGVPAIQARYSADNGSFVSYVDCIKLLVDGVGYDITTAWTNGTPQEMVDALQQASRDIRIKK